MTRRPGRSARAHSALRFLDRHRRLAAAACTALAVGAALSVVAPAPPPTTVVLAAARELSAGHVISAGDLTSVAVPPGAVPDGALTAHSTVVGRAVALPVRRGEMLTDVRIAGSALRTQLTGPTLLAAPVRIADPAAVALLTAGDRIDILGAAEGLAQAIVVASDVLVIATPEQSDGVTTDGDGGALIVVAATADTSRRLAQAAVVSRLSVVVRS